MITSLARRGWEKFLWGALLVLALIYAEIRTGQAIAYQQPFLVYLLFAGLGGALLLFYVIPRNPFLIFLVWLGLGALLQPYEVELGASIPNITFARVLILLLSFFLVTKKVFSKQPLSLQVPDLCILFFSAYYGVLLFTTSSSGRTELLNFMTYLGLPFLVYFLTRALVRHPDNLQQISRVLLFEGLALSGLGFYEHFTGTSLFTPWSRPFWTGPVLGSYSAAASLGNPSIYGCFLAMVISLNLYFFSLAKDRRWRALYGASIILNAVAVYYSYRRASWVVLAVVLLAGLIGNRRLRGMLSASLILVVLMIVLQWSNIVESPLWQQRVMASSSVEGRFDLYSVQWSLASENPVFGLGLGIVSRGALVGGAASHDTFMTLLLDGGLVLVLLYVLPLLVVWRRSMVCLSSLPREGVISKGLVWSLWGALMAYLLMAITLDMRFFTFVSCVFWMFIGIVWQLPELQIQATLNAVSIKERTGVRR